MIVDLAVEAARRIDPRNIEEIAQLSQAAERALNAHLDSHGDVWDVHEGPCSICVDLNDIDRRLWDRLEAMGQ
jgi:hypothetical protein